MLNDTIIVPLGVYRVSGSCPRLPNTAILAKLAMGDS
jgi:hypothetical protein